MSRGPFQQVLGGLGTISQSGIFRAAVQNLWATIPIGIMAYMSVQKRRKSNSLTAMNVVSDLAPVVMIVGTLVILNHTLEEREKTKAKPRAAGAPPMATPLQAQATDASFTPVQGAHPVMAFTEAAPPAATPVATPVEDDTYGS